LFLIIMIARPFRRFDGNHHSVWAGMAAGMCAQLGVVLAHNVGARLSHYPSNDWQPLVSILANGLGIGLMVLVFNDSWVRLNSERHRLDAERSKALASQAQLIALRARIHPHFLYNTLTSIAGLCAIAPDKAQDATVKLGELMRRTLEASGTTLIPLRAELDNVATYLSIEQNRLGPRLSICWEIDPAATDAQVPPLSIQTLVENSVGHGIAAMVEPGTLTIFVRRRSWYTLIGVKDDGPGIASSARPKLEESEEKALHGMQILTNQLILLHGRAARLRLFSAPDCGTLVTFAVPIRNGGPA
jgi:two-component system sensor histidine kinase LytS